MAETTIEWAHYTFNPWWGCSKCSPGCDNCYAEGIARRFHGLEWGVKCKRLTFDDKHWLEPIGWNSSAAKGSRKRIVFCASMCDLFDANRPQAEFERLVDLTKRTPYLTWLWLTKRPQGLGAMGTEYLSNVKVGVSVEDAAHWYRVDEMFEYASYTWRARCRRFSGYFVSLEPMLGPVTRCDNRLDWIIVGGESGCRARVCRVDWIKDYIDIARDHKVPVFVKQLGSRAMLTHHTRLDPHKIGSKGQRVEQWPEGLRRRERPRW